MTSKQTLDMLHYIGIPTRGASSTLEWEHVYHLRRWVENAIGPDRDLRQYEYLHQKFKGHSRVNPDGPAEPTVGHRKFEEDSTGVTYDSLFMPYIDTAQKIEVTDPYIRTYNQAWNLVEFLDMVNGNLSTRKVSAEVILHTCLAPDEEDRVNQQKFLDRVVRGASGTNLRFQYNLNTIGHDRSILTDTGWTIVLGRGLDIYKSPHRDPLALNSRMQAVRKIRSFSITYVR